MNLLHMPEGNRTIKVYSSFSDFASQSSRQEPLHAVSELRHSGDDKRAVLSPLDQARPVFGERPPRSRTAPDRRFSVSEVTGARRDAFSPMVALRKICLFGFVRVDDGIARVNEPARRGGAPQPAFGYSGYSLNRLAHAPIEGRRGGGWPTAGCGRRAARARKSIALTARACRTAQA
jgi:hypothetical protein